LVSPEYSARKHHVPTPVAVNDGDVAVPPAVNATPPPTAVPPLAQSLAVVKKPQTKKFTVPVGIPPAELPLTKALSVFGSPRATVERPGLLVVPASAAVTVKHSVLLPSDDGEWLLSPE
jgi:hypothetical protein